MTEVAYLRPWGVDLAGLLDYLGHGSPSDALRGLVRTALQVDVADLVQGHVGLRQETVDANGQTLIVNQRNRCPLSMERGMAWKPTPDYPCDPSQVPPGR